MATQGITSDQVRDAAIIEQLLAPGSVTSAKIGADAIDGTKIADDAIDSEHIAADALDAEHYAPGSVDTTALGAGAVTEAKIGTGAVTSAKIGADAVDGSKIADDSIDSEHIAADSIDAEHYAPGSVDNTALGADAVDGSKIADDSIDSEHYAAGSIDSEHYAAGSVDTTALGADAVTGAKLADDAVNAEHIGALTAAIAYNTAPTLSNATDIPHKGYVDGLVSGLQWKDPICAKDYIGTRTVTEINALTPSSGDTVVAGDAGTPSAGTSDALAAGDVAEFDGTSWKKIISNSGGFVPDGVRLLVAAPDADTLYSPLTDGTHEGYYADFDGTTNTPTLSAPSNGDALIVNCNHDAASVNENIGYTWSTADDDWIQFTGAGQINAGNGLSKTANTLDVNVDDTGIEINADTLRLKDSGVTTAKINADAVDGTKIADDAVDSEHIAAGALDEEHLSLEVQGRMAEVVMDDGSLPTTTSEKGFVDGSGNEGLVEAQGSADDTVKIDLGGIAYNHRGERLTLPTSASIGTFGVVSANPRHDIVVLDASGALAIRQGSEAASPSDPALTAGDVPLARVLIDETVTVVVNTGDITDLRERKSIDGAKIIDGSIPASALASNGKLYARKDVFYTRVTGTGGGTPTAGTAFSASGGGAGKFIRSIDSTTWEIAQFSGTRIADTENITVGGDTLTNITKVAAYDNEPDGSKTTFNVVPVPGGDAEQFDLASALIWRNGNLCEVVEYTPTDAHEVKLTQSSGSTQGTAQFGTALLVGERIDAKLDITN